MAYPEVQANMTGLGNRGRNKRKGGPASNAAQSLGSNHLDGNSNSIERAVHVTGPANHQIGTVYSPTNSGIPTPAGELSFSDEESSFDENDQLYHKQQRQASRDQQKRPRGVSSNNSCGPDPSEFINSTMSGLHMPRPQPGVSNNTVKTIARSARDNSLWNTSTLEERGRIKEFWLSLSEEERKSLLKIEKDAVLRKMKEQQKHSCSCTVCGRKRTAIEEELEALYDAYYDELEQYANVRQQAALDSTQLPPPPPPPLPPSHRLPSPPRRMMYASKYARQSHSPAAYEDHLRRPQPHLPLDSRPEHRSSRIREVLDVDDRSADEEVDDQDDPEEVYSDEYEDDESYEDDGEGYELPPDSIGAGFFDFGNSLTVKGRRDANHRKFQLTTAAGGILTVADDLLQNDGRKFIEMMEQLAERRMQREHEVEYNDPQPVHHPPPLDMPVEEDDEYEDDEDYDSQEEYEQDYEVDEMVRPAYNGFDATKCSIDWYPQGGLTEEQRMEEGRRMFQIFAARMFEQRVLTAYRERVASERQRKLLEELDDDAKLDEQRKNKKQKDAEKKKNKKQAQKAAKAEAQAAKDKAKAEQEAAAKAAQEASAKEQREKKESQKKEAQEKKKRQDEERKLKEAEKAQQKRLELEEREAKAFKLREQKVLEKKQREDREREEREAKAKASDDKHSIVADRLPAKPTDVAAAPASKQGLATDGTRQPSKTTSPASAVATPVMPKAIAANRARQSQQQDTRVASPALASAMPGQKTSPDTLNDARTTAAPPKHAVPSVQLPQQNNYVGPHGTPFGLANGLAFGSNGTPPLAARRPSAPGFHMQQPLQTQSRGNVMMPHPPGFHVDGPPPGMFQPSPIGAPAHIDHMSYSNHSRPAPIQRPSTFAQPMPGDDESNRHLGSSALLDGADEPLPRPDNRKFSNPPVMGRIAPMGFSPPLFTSLPGQGTFGGAPATTNFVGTPSSWSASNAMPPGNETQMWGMPMGGNGWSSAGFGASARPSNANRPLTIRLAVCQACRQLSQRTGPDTYHDVSALLRQMELNGVLHTAPPMLKEIEEICETEGDAHNGGGLLSFRQTGENNFAVCFDEDSAAPMMNRTPGAPLGEIGSPVSPPSQSGPQRGLGKLMPDLPHGGGF